jgi:drug/metabolite transporter (DMT)-like permease
MTGVGFKGHIEMNEVEQVKTPTKQKVNLKNILALQGVFFIFSLATVMQRMAAHSELYSLHFFIFLGTVVFILGVYALLWQQVIKRFELSVAYANKALSLLWILLWGYFLFDETITMTKVIGVVIVIVGVIIMNSRERTGSE